MHHPSPLSSELGFLPAMYSFPGLVNIPEIGINIGPALGTSHHLPGVSPPNTSWERRCLRKHRRRADDEGCSAKRRRLMGEAGCNPLDNSNPNMCQSWPPSSIQPPVPEQLSPAVPQPCSESQSLGLPLFMSPSPLPCPEKEGSCMELEAAQRRLQEIEERITLEDDDDDEDLDVEPAQRRPVLVMSDSLREGLQRGIGDILPHTVAQSVSQSCMELVVWRPPEDALARRLKDSLQRQRKQQTTCRQPPTPSPSPTRQISLTPTAPPAETYSPLYHSPGAHSSGEEDMEL